MTKIGILYENNPKLA